MPNLKSIVTEWLKANGYDGLCNDEECGCGIDDLMPCGEPGEHCVAGHKTVCCCGEGHDFDIVEGRKEAGNG